MMEKPATAADMLVVRSGRVEDARGDVRVEYEAAESDPDDLDLWVTIQGPQGQIGELRAHRYWMARMLPVLVRALADATAAGLLPDPKPGAWPPPSALSDGMIKALSAPHPHSAL